MTDKAKQAAKLLGRLGGLKGGNARAASLTAERRAEIAQKAAIARWGKKPDGDIENATGVELRWPKPKVI